MSLLDSFTERIELFLKTANRNQLKMILVGGGAVNFHGYQRHSADLDFWVDIRPENLTKLLITLNEIGYSFDDFPEKVKKGEQNISIKISPIIELELITSFNPGKSFSEAFEKSELVQTNDFYYNVLNFNDLIQSKITTERPKDKLDVEELHRIRLKKKS